MRRAANIDKNQPDIVKHLRSAGVAVVSLAAVGNGIPDLLCGWRGVNALLEIKDPSSDASLSLECRANQRLNATQIEWHRTWPGQKAVVTTFGEAMAEIIRVWTATQSIESGALAKK